MDLGSQLPIEIEAQVLSFVRVPNLCWNRSVCKRWNQIISDPYFAALCVQSQSKKRAPFLILHYILPSYYGTKTSPQYCILDLRARRWYRPADAHKVFLRVLDMDAGLVLGEDMAMRSYQPSAMVVYNPLDKTEEEVLPAPYHSSVLCRSPMLSLVVDNIAQTFKILRVEENFGEGLKNPNRPALQIYNSATKEWKGVTNVWCKPKVGGEESAWPESRVMFQRCLYVLFRHITRFTYATHQIWRYDLVRELWEYVPILMDYCNPQPAGKLIVSADRLFMVSRSLVRFHLNQFRVTEINIRRMTSETVFTWTKAQALEVFDMEDDGTDCLSIDVFGFDNSLMFMPHGSSPGNLRAFDFVTRKWDCEWARHPLGLAPSDEHCYWGGKQMNFLLPGTPW